MIALEYILDDEHSLPRAEIFTNLAILYSKIKDDKTASHYNDKAIDIFRYHHNAEWLTRALGKKAAINRDRGALNKAAELYTEAYEVIHSKTVNKTNPDTRDIAVIKLKNGILNNIADIYLRKNERDIALIYLHKMDVDTALLPLYFLTARTITIGEAYSQKHEFKKAADLIESGLRHAIEHQFNDIRLACHNELSSIYAHLRQFEKALRHQAEYTKMREQHFGETESKIHSVKNLESQYYLARKDKEIAEKQLRINKQAASIREKNLWAGIMVICLLFLGSTLAISRKNYQHRQRLLQAQLTSEEKTRRILLAEATANGEAQERERIAKELHDSIASEVMAMTLNLEAMAVENSHLNQSTDYRNILIQSKKITQKLRETAHNLMPKNIRELGLYRSIGAFINKVSGPKIKCTFQHYGDLPPLQPDEEKIILHISLELIQNVIKHARATEAIVQFHYHEGTLSITVEDNGVGMPLHSEQAHEGLGWANLKRNISILNGSVDIQSSEYTGSTVFIEIPISSQKTDSSTINSML